MQSHHTHTLLSDFLIHICRRTTTWICTQQDGLQPALCVSKGKTFTGRQLVTSFNTVRHLHAIVVLYIIKKSGIVVGSGSAKIKATISLLQGRCHSEVIRCTIIGPTV